MPRHLRGKASLIGEAFSGLSEVREAQRDRREGERAYRVCNAYGERAGTYVRKLPVPTYSIAFL